MPEGPEIRRAADKLARVLEGQQVMSVRFAFTALKSFESRLRGQMVQAVTPRGKAMLTEFSNGLTLYSHNQLYGQWVVRKGEAPPLDAPGRQLRVALQTATHAALLYSASEIEVLETRRVAAHPYIARLGVELLDPRTTRTEVRAQVSATRFAGRNVAGLLLDQGFLAGIGNYLRSDILFAAGIHPSRKLGQLSPDERDALADAALALTRQSYRQRGISNDLARAAAQKAQGATFGEYRHAVFDRAGLPCYQCGQTVVREEWTGRGLFFCPHCQPQAPLAAKPVVEAPAGLRKTR